MTTSRRDPVQAVFLATVVSLVVFAAWSRALGGGSQFHRPNVGNASATLEALTSESNDTLRLAPAAATTENVGGAPLLGSSTHSLSGDDVATFGDEPVESARDDLRNAAKRPFCVRGTNRGPTRPGGACSPSTPIERLWATAAANDAARNRSVLYHHRYLKNRNSSSATRNVGSQLEADDRDEESDGVYWRNDVNRATRIHVELESFCRTEAAAAALETRDGSGGRRTLEPREWRAWGVHEPLGWNANGQHRMCIRGREIFVGSPSAGPQAENQTGEVPRTATSLPQKIRWQLNRRRVTIRSLPEVSSPSYPYRGTVHLHRGLGVVASVYFQAFHVLGNTVLPLYQLFRKWCRDTTTTTTATSTPTDDVATVNSWLSSSSNDIGGEGRHLHAPLNHSNTSSSFPPACPLWDLYLYRELPGGAKLVGGEDFSLTIAAGFATRRATILRSVTEGGQDTSVTHCYCHGVLHNMLDISTVPASQKIVFGDPKRRAATRFLKEQLNERFQFLPYGTEGLVPPSELNDFGLWTSVAPLEPNFHAAATPPPPRLLLVLRSTTRVLGDAAAVRNLAERVGFHVQVMFPERVPIAVQARAARYADVLMGVHGQALTWSFMMDGTRATHCRELIELAYFGRPLRGMHNCFEVMAADSNLLYTRVLPTHVEWLVNCTANPKGCRSWHVTMLSTNFPQKQTAFFKQKVFFRDNPKLERALVAAYERVRHCAWKQVAVDIPSRYVFASGKASTRY